MITFECDYTEGAHIKLLEKLMETNLEPLSGYGEDKYSESAKEKIKKAMLNKEFIITSLLMTKLVG
jgi:threonine aldolase